MGKLNRELLEIDMEIQKKQIELFKLKIQRAKKILKLREKGKTYKQIGAILGISKQAIHQAINPKYKRIETSLAIEKLNEKI